MSPPPRWPTILHPLAWDTGEPLAVERALEVFGWREGGSGPAFGSFAMPEANEEELLKSAQAGDRRAFGELVRIHQRRVYACAMQMLGDRTAAEDAVQETFLRAWRAISRFDGRSALSTWLYRVCVNVCLNRIRKRKRHDAADLSDPKIAEPVADPTQGDTDPRKSSEARELRDRLADAMAQLSPSLRSTVILVLIQGVPQKEAAETLGCSEGTIAWRIHEARRRLRSVLVDWRGEEEPESSEEGAKSRDGRKAS